MPLHWDIATLERASLAIDDAIWTIGPSEWGDIAKGGVLMALCDSRGIAKASNDVSQNAVSVLDDFYYQPPRQEDDPESTLADAVAQALFTVKFYGTDRQLALEGDSGAAVKAAHERSMAQNASAGGSLTLIAAVVKHGILYIAYTGRNRAYLWRKGELRMLTIEPLATEPSSEESIQHAQFQLEPKDRLLLCTEGFYQNVDEPVISDILNIERDVRRATAALLDAAAKAQPTTTVSVAVLNYTPVFPSIIVPIGLGAVLLSIIAVALIVTTLLNSSRLSPQESANAAGSATPVLVQTNTAAPANGTNVVKQAPIAGADVTTATMTITPRPTSTPSTTPTPSPQPTSTATATQEPTATATPEPSATVPPSTPTPQPPTRTPQPTRTPAPTAVPTIGYAQPKLLAPAFGWVFMAPDVPRFAWSDVGPLAADDYYVLAIQHTKGVDEQWVKGTSATARDYLLLLRGPTPFKWSVSIRRKTGKASNGGDAGPVLVQSAETREFSWNPQNPANPGGSGRGPGNPQPTSESTQPGPSTPLPISVPTSAPTQDPGCKPGLGDIICTP